VGAGARKGGEINEDWSTWEGGDRRPSREGGNSFPGKERDGKKRYAEKTSGSASGSGESLKVNKKTSKKHLERIVWRDGEKIIQREQKREKADDKLHVTTRSGGDTQQATAKTNEERGDAREGKN